MLKSCYNITLLWSDFLYQEYEPVTYIRYVWLAKKHLNDIQDVKFSFLIFNKYAH